MRSRLSESRRGGLRMAALAAVWLGVVGAIGSMAAPLGSTARDRAALKVLQQECFACHGDAKRKGGLSLSSREALLQGGG